MDFDVLKDLVQTITRNKIKQIEVLGNPGNTESRTEELYNGIYSDQFRSEDEAAKHFFGTNEKDPKYRKLRNRLIRQLINTSFFIDVQQPMFNERGKALFNCYRDYVAAYMLRSRDAHKASLYLLLQLMEQTIKFEFTDITTDVCRQLRQLFALSHGDQANHEKYSELHRLYEEKRHWEAKAYDYSENLVHHYITGRSPNNDIYDLATRYYDELLSKSDEIDTMHFYAHTYKVGVIKYSSINDCQKIIEVCDEALNILQNRAVSNRGSLALFATQKLTCLTQLRIFDEGDKTAEFCLSQVDEGSFNWFRVLEAQYYYYMYTKRYQLAINVFEKVIQQDRYSLLSGSTRDIWTMLGGYLHLLAALGKLDPEEVENIAGYYNPDATRYGNNFEVLDKEKDGMNIPLVLLPLLFSVAKGNFNENLSGRSVEALDKYRKRYLETDTNRRSAIFLKMVLALTKKEFDGAKAERKMEKERALLEKEPAQMANQSFAVEVIPYEDLWEMLLEKQA